MEAEIRKKRKEEIYERQELIRKIWEVIGWIVLFCTVVGFIILLAWMYKEIEDETEKITKTINV